MRITFAVSDAEGHEIKNAAKRRSLSVSSLCRTGIMAELRKHRPKSPQKTVRDEILCVLEDLGLTSPGDVAYGPDGHLRVVDSQE